MNLRVSISFKFSGYPEEFLQKEVEKRNLLLLVNEKDMPFISLEGAVNVSEIRKLAESFRHRFDTLVVVGMGGSSLGTKAIHDALYYKSDRRLLFLDNVDPVLVMETLKSISLKDTAFAFVSKSGKTAETVTILNLVLDILKKRAFNLSRHLVFIGEKEKSFEKLAEELGAPFLAIPSEVGGRFSVLTSVGLFPAAFAGYDLDKFLEGAKSSIREPNYALMLSLWKFLHYTNGRRISVIMPYTSCLREFSEWYTQLWGESLGKDGKGQTPMKAIGTPSRHSVFQLFMDGPDDKIYQLFLVKEYPEDPVLPERTVVLPFLANKKLSDVMKAEFNGALRALTLRNRPMVVFELLKPSEFELGYLFMTYMIATVGMAKLMKVNPYDQPAVEIGKKFALEELRKGE